jgi:hypothetical protein
MTETSCPDCDLRKEKIPGIYNVTCPECRLALLLAEPCKIIRQRMAERMVNWGDPGNYRIEPNCGCVKSCARLANIRETE